MLLSWERAAARPHSCFLPLDLNWFQLNHSLAHDIQSPEINIDDAGNKIWKFNSYHSL